MQGNHALQKKKELNVDFRQQNSFALADTNLINLVFENLIYNFIKYVNDFGHLLVDFEQDEQKVKVILIFKKAVDQQTNNDAYE